YHGWVVGIPVADPGAVRAWRTKARGGGVWAPGGVASDGTSLFVTTGNTFGAARWGGGESIIRLRPRLVFGARRADHFTPPDWRALDANDVDRDRLVRDAARHRLADGDDPRRPRRGDRVERRRGGRRPAARLRWGHG